MEYTVDLRIVGEASIVIEAHSQREAEDMADALVGGKLEPPKGWSFESPDVIDVRPAGRLGNQ